MTEAKQKLRTAAEVVSRLKWDVSFCDSQDELIFGYSDRIHGPMEKCLQDYVPASQGGDIPEHRINYFLKGSEVLWDRRSRFDKIFGNSGNKTARVSSETLSDIPLARATAERLTEERQIRLQERIKRSHNRQRKVLINDHKLGDSSDRHVWVAAKIDAGQGGKRLQPIDHVRILTWNVLFDKYDTEPADDRWRLSLKRIGDEMADIVLLQEVTLQYARTLLKCDWFVENYHASASLDNLTSVEPFGNMLLWKTSVFEVATNQGIFTCFDGDRNRAVLGVLRNDKHVFIVSNVHLPADHAMIMMSDNPNNVISPKERRIARQRERVAIIAKSQVLQEFYESMGNAVTCIMGGDFNIVEEVEVLDGRFSMFFRDAWTEFSTDRGDTFDPESNIRAISNKGPRRIDRIYLGDTLREYRSEQGFALRPVGGSLIGKLSDVGADRCPSDHYGVLIDCKFIQTTRPGFITSSKAWSCCSQSSYDTLLALCFDCHDVSKHVCDQDSSLPIPHITMLHGFVELNNDESRHLALRSIEKAIFQSLEERCCFPLFFDETSLSVFEHRASASVVYLPAHGCEANQWLQALYSTLRAVFPQCDDQETRFESGWCAHLTLGTYPTVEMARSVAQSHVLVGKTVQLNAHSLGLFQRSQADPRFFMISAVPLVQPRQGQSFNPTIGSVTSFVEDAGTSAWMHFKSLADNVAVETQRACQWVLDKHWSGLSANTLPHGSYLLCSSIPGISDLDLIVNITSTSRVNELSDFDELRFFQHLKSRIESTSSRSKVRLRLAGSPGDAHFYILTARLAPDLPAVDLMLQVRDPDPYESIKDSLFILTMLDKSSIVFSQALRLVKVWAFRRHVYGPAVGFLGGGGWAVLLAYHMILNHEEGEETPIQLAASFFVSLPSILKKMPAQIDLNEFLTAGSVTAIDDSCRDKGQLHIWSPESRKNHARNSTHGTIATMISEAERARLLVLESEASLVKLFETIVSPFIPNQLTGSAVLELVVNAENIEKSVTHQELKAWLCRQALAMMLSLEREYGFVGYNVRPLSRPCKVKEKLSILLSVNTAISGSFITRRRVAMQEEFYATFQTSIPSSQTVEVVIHNALMSYEHRASSSDTFSDVKASEACSNPT